MIVIGFHLLLSGVAPFYVGQEVEMTCASQIMPAVRQIAFHRGEESTLITRCFYKKKEWVASTTPHEIRLSGCQSQTPPEKNKFVTITLTLTLKSSDDAALYSCQMGKKSRLAERQQDIVFHKVLLSIPGPLFSKSPQHCYPVIILQHTNEL